MEYCLIFCLRLYLEKIPITNYMNIEQKPLPFSITATVSKMNEDYLDYTYEDPYAVQPERLRRLIMSLKISFNYNYFMH